MLSGRETVKPVGKALDHRPVMRDEQEREALVGKRGDEVENFARTCASSAEVASSSTITGSTTKARASAMRWR
jgi:hypothetical protein